jgi:hypothetical protein
MRRVLLVMAATACASIAAGCGELPQTVFYEQGQYRGKADSLPFEGGDFKGNKTAWEQALKARNNGQNEYVRIGH